MKKKKTQKLKLKNVFVFFVRTKQAKRFGERPRMRKIALKSQKEPIKSSGEKTRNVRNGDHLVPYRRLYWMHAKKLSKEGKLKY